jgi:hypothetical protein
MLRRGINEASPDKAVLAVLINVMYIDETQENYEEYQPELFNRDIIATICQEMTL